MNDQEADKSRQEMHQQLDTIQQAHVQTQIQIGRFDERLKGLEVNVKDGFKDLKENLLGRVNDLAANKLAASDFVNFRNEQVGINDDVEKRVRIVETIISNFKGKYAILAVVGMLLVSIIGAVASNFVIKSSSKPTTTVTCVDGKAIVNCP